MKTSETETRTIEETIEKITFTCDTCGKEEIKTKALGTGGFYVPHLITDGIPPRNGHTPILHKYHLCVDCFEDFEQHILEYTKAYFESEITGQGKDLPYPDIRDFSIDFLRQIFTLPRNRDQRR